MLVENEMSSSESVTACSFLGWATEGQDIIPNKI